jgi:predicted Rdx family selenoprotein
MMTAGRHDANALPKEVSMPSSGGSHHIVPNPDGGWDIKKGGSGRSSGHLERKQDAVDAGRDMSRNQRTELYVHGEDGRIQRKDSHGNDPFPPKG